MRSPVPFRSLSSARQSSVLARCAVLFRRSDEKKAKRQPATDDDRRRRCRAFFFMRGGKEIYINWKEEKYNHTRIGWKKSFVFVSTLQFHRCVLTLFWILRDGLRKSVLCVRTLIFHTLSVAIFTRSSHPTSSNKSSCGREVQHFEI